QQGYCRPIGAAFFCGQCGQSLMGVLGQTFWNLFQCFSNNGLLLVPFTVGTLLFLVKRAELEGNDEGTGVGVPGDFVQSRQKEALFTLDVVLFVIGAL